jgi:hypothetical protein
VRHPGERWNDDRVLVPFVVAKNKPGLAVNSEASCCPVFEKCSTKVMGSTHCRVIFAALFRTIKINAITCFKRYYFDFSLKL